MKKNFEIQKLRVVTYNTRQIVKEKEGLVITKVDYHVQIPRQIADASGIFGYDPRGGAINFWQGRLTGTCTGKAVLAKGDKWDIEKGKAISKAHAEKNAYRQAANRVNKIQRRLNKAVIAFSEMVIDLNERSMEVVDHNISYIDSIAGE